MRKLLLFICYFISGATFLFGQNKEAQKINFDIQGSVELNYMAYFNKEAQKINSRNEGTLNLKGILEFDEEAAFKIEIESRKDLQDNFRNRLLYVREAYFLFVDKKIDVRIGKQLANWGTADIYSPTNNLNPVDYSDFFDLEDNQLGVWMIRAKHYHSNHFYTEALISPFLPKTAVPNPNSRWVVGLPTEMPHPSQTNVFIPINYEYADLYPDFNDIGLMMGLRNGITFGQWDISQSLLVGPNFSPTFTDSLNSFDVSEIIVDLKPNYQRQYVVGLDFATAFKHLGLRGEMALKGLSEPNSKKGLATLYYEYTIGVDHTFSRLLFNKNVTTILQWVQQIVIKDEQPMEGNIRFFLRRAIALRTDLAINYFSSVTIQTLYTLDARNWYVQSSLKYRVLDGLTVKASTDIVFGKANGFLGQYINNDRFQLKLIYDF